MRIRTLKKAYAELLEEDPKCGLSYWLFRQNIYKGRWPSCKSGDLYLVDLDQIVEILKGGRVNERA